MVHILSRQIMWWWATMHTYWQIHPISVVVTICAGNQRCRRIVLRIIKTWCVRLCIWVTWLRARVQCSVVFGCAARQNAASSAYHFTVCILFCLLGLRLKWSSLYEHHLGEKFLFVNHYFIWLNWTIVLDTPHWKLNWGRGFIVLISIWVPVLFILFLVKT